MANEMETGHSLSHVADTSLATMENDENTTTAPEDLLMSTENVTVDNGTETERSSPRMDVTSPATMENSENTATAPAPEDDMEMGHHSLPESAEDLKVDAGRSVSSFAIILQSLRWRSVSPFSGLIGRLRQSYPIEFLRQSGVLGRLRQRNVLLAALCVVVLVLVISVGVGISNGSSSSQQSERMIASVQFLSLVSNPTALQRGNGAQYAAADWMANQDTLQYPVPSSLDDDNSPLFLQRYALAVLYYALGGNKWTFNSRFLSKYNECEWYQSFRTQDGKLQLGVTCDDELGRVSELRFPGNNLDGRIPPEIGLLTHLHHITLFSNSIDGHLPEEMASLTGLDFLSLGSNDISGTIPPWLGGLKSLEALDMSDNKLTGFIPPSITKMTSLIELALDTNSLVGDVNVLNGIPSLKRLYLSENLFAGKVNEVFSNLQLVELDMSDNNFAGTIPLHLFSLKVLDLSRNVLTGPLPDFPERDDTMEYLSLCDNQLSGHIGESIWNLTGLRHLDLSNNEFSGYMPGYVIAWMYNLTYLFMANNPFEADVIPEIWDMTSLRELSLKNTKRTGSIPAWMGTNLTNLVLLDLGENELVGTIPETLGKLDKLSFLILNGNNLNGTVPGSFDELDNIAMLLLHDNNLSGDMEHICTSNATSNLDVLTSQCGGNNPPITCSCCTTCCKDGQEKCVRGDLLATFDLDYENFYNRDEYVFSEDYIFRTQS